MSKMKINHWISGEKTSSDIPASPHVSASPSQPWSILFASAEIGQVALVLHLAKDTKEAWEEKLWFSKKNTYPKFIAILILNLARLEENRLFLTTCVGNL